VEKKEYIGIFCFLRPNVYHASKMYSNHAFPVCFEYKCHIINFFINLACLVCIEKYRTSVFLYKPRCTKKTSVYRPRVRLTQFDPQILISDVYDGKIKY
jgi:hypothetical protein